MATSDFQLGPCQILYGDAGAETDLGKTVGGVTITVEETYSELHSDQDGTGPVDEIKTGTKLTIEGALAEITLDNLAAVFKTTVITDGTDSTKKKVEITNGVGTSLLANSKSMIVKPYVDGVPSTDANDWITMSYAAMKATADLTYDAENQRTIKFSAVGYPDTSTGVIAVFGDTTATP